MNRTTFYFFSHVGYGIEFLGIRMENMDLTQERRFINTGAEGMAVWRPDGIFPISNLIPIGSSL